MRSRFDGELMLLNKELIEMGALCEDAIELVAKALHTNDGDVYKEVENATTGANLVKLLESNTDSVITTIINKFATAIKKIKQPLTDPNIFITFSECLCNLCIQVCTVSH